MLDDLLTEAADPDSAELDLLGTAGILKAIHAGDARVAAAVGAEIPHIAKAVDAIVEAIDRGGHLFYIGAGTSGRLGVLDAVECPPTFSVPPDLVRGIIAGGEAALSQAAEAGEDDPEAGARDLVAAGFTGTDVLVGITASGRTPYVLGAIAKAKSLGAVTCGISCNPRSELSKTVDFPIEPKTGPEAIAGSTRMRAGTATKMILNLISTAVMVRLGHVYGNRMVNVQPSNAKLAARAQKIVCDVTGLRPEEGAALFEAAGRNVRTAIVMHQKRISRQEAEQLLQRANGRLRQALA